MVKKALDELPKGSKALDVAYNKAMQRVDSQLEGYRHLAKQLLGWLTYSERLMSVQEIQYALAIELGESSLDEDNLSDVIEIVGYCAGLVIVEVDTRSLRLVHYTTQEYFRQNSGKHLVSAQQDIAISCLTYLLYEEFANGWIYEFEEQEIRYIDHFLSQGIVRVRLWKHPFLGYAAKYWANHASVCEQQITRELTMNFAKHNHKVSSVGQIILAMDSESLLCRDLESTKSRSPLGVMHVLAYIGNKAMFSELLNHGFEADAEDATHRTPLLWAVEGRQYDMVEFLLSENRVRVNVNVYVNAYMMKSPLYVAVDHGHTSMVKLLLDHADIDLNLRNAFGITSLYLAASRGNTSIVKLLLDHAGIDVNLQNEFGSVPLHIAAIRGQISTVKLLCAHPKIDMDLRDNEGLDVFSLVKGESNRMVGYETKKEYDKGKLVLEHCLDIIGTAIEERKFKSSAQHAEQSSQT